MKTQRQERTAQEEGGEGLHHDPLSPRFRQEMEKKGQTFKNPETGNKVKFGSLPWKEQQKFYSQWTKREKAAGRSISSGKTIKAKGHPDGVPGVKKVQTSNKHLTLFRAHHGTYVHNAKTGKLGYKSKQGTKASLGAHTSVANAAARMFAHHANKHVKLGREKKKAKMQSMAGVQSVTAEYREAANTHQRLTGRVRRLLEMGWTLSEVADTMGVPQHVLSHWMRGVYVKLPTEEQLERLLDAIDSPTWKD